MRKKDFVPAIIAWLLAHGAEPIVGSAYDYRLLTRAGELLVSPTSHLRPRPRSGPGSVFTRFRDVTRAKKLLEGYINPYSGKWNHHYFADTNPDQAFDDFVSRVEPILSGFVPCSRCSAEAKTAVITRCFGREVVCNACRNNLLADGQIVTSKTKRKETK